MISRFTPFHTTRLVIIFLASLQHESLTQSLRPGTIKSAYVIHDRWHSLNMVLDVPDDYSR